MDENNKSSVLLEAPNLKEHHFTTPVIDIDAIPNYSVLIKVELHAVKSGCSKP
jgi:hypothetical protein